MLGFVPASQDVTIASGGPPITWELSLKSFEEIIGGTAATTHSPRDARAPPPAGQEASIAIPSRNAASGERGQSPVAGSGGGSPGFRRTPVSATPGAPQ